MIARRPIDPYLRKQPWVHPPGLGPTGRRFCCCGCGREVGKNRSSSHDKACVDWWKSHSDLNAIKFQVRQRDKGVCALCQTDTEKLRAEWHRALEAFGRTKRCEQPFHWSHVRMVFWNDPAIPKPPPGFPTDDRRWWEADHTVPVVEGGGGCDFNGYRTLCLPCHRKETAALRKRMSAAVLTPCCRVRPAVLDNGPILTVRCACGITHRYDQRRRAYEPWVASTTTLLITPDMYDLKPAQPGSVSQ